MPRGIYKRKDKFISKNCLVCQKEFKTIISEINRGNGKCCSRICGFKNPRKRGEESPFWKGDKVKKVALHEWVSKCLGKPSKCEFCKTTTAKVFDWSNKSQKYKRDLTDWQRLCRSCHIKYDDTINRRVLSGWREKIIISKRKK